LSALPDTDYSIQPGPPDEPDAPSAPWIVPLDQLTAHPGNVRDDLDLTPQFCASVAEAGVRIPLLVTPAEAGYRVIEGHRRLAAAVKARLAGVPCTLGPDRAGDEAGQYLDMAVANGEGYRKNFTAQQEADALFAASEAGATRTRIRKTTGRSAQEVKAALQAAKLSGDTRALAADLDHQPSLEELALLAEFEGDEQATAVLLGAIGEDYGVEHAAERLRRKRAEAAEHDQLVAELEAAGVMITDAIPDGARWISTLTHDGQDLTPENHAECPGRGATFRSWGPLEPDWYCTSPDACGHVYKYQQLVPAAPGSSGTPDALPDPPADPDDAARRAARRLVIEGNKAWVAAAEVRKRWLRTLLTRRTAAPRTVIPFIAAQLLSMPEPLRASLATAHSSALLADLAGHDGSALLEACATSPAGRLPLLMLAPVVTAYEQELCDADGFRRSTWRTDTYAPCPRDEAGAYLAFLASLGYELSVIEQAVADGTPYTGDTPGEPLVNILSDEDAPGEPDAEASEDAAGAGLTADEEHAEEAAPDSAA
jgi:ParB family chromosome partitioning protein